MGLVALAGCSDDKVNPNDDKKKVYSSDPLTAEELCVAKTISGAGEGVMCFQNNLLTPDDPAIAPGVLERICRPGMADRIWAEELLAAAASGRVTMDWAKARQCLDESRELRKTNPGIDLVKSGDWTAVRSVCDGAYKGAVATGGACANDWECAAATDGCYTDTPTVAGSKTCQQGKGNGQSCSPEYFECRDGFYCDSTALECTPVKGEGEDCAADEECGSGKCDPNESVCLMSATKGDGDSCTEDAECGSMCTGCVKGKCQTFGGEGDACDDWFDCANDLGCTGGVCTTVGVGERCSGPSEGACDFDLACLGDVDCSAHASEGACSGDEFCAWNGEACQAVMGHCYALPTSGPCAADQACATGHYCDEASITCVKAANLGEICEPEGNGAPMCNAGLTCIAGSCAYACEINADCAAGQYCLSDDSGAPPSCQSIVTSGCEASVECGDGKYCMTPDEVCAAYDDATGCNGNSKCTYERNGTCDPKVDCTLLDETECGMEATCAVEEESACQPSGMCGTHTTEGACNAANGCKYFAGYGCLDKCLEFDGDAAGCAAAPGCEYDSTLSYCNSSCASITNSTTCGTTSGCGYGVVSRECTQVYDCSPNDNNESACTADTKCEFTDTSECVPTDVAVGECIDKYAIGQEDAACLTLDAVGTGESEICASGVCYVDESGIGRCSERTNYGCVADRRPFLQELVNLALLFGLVVMRRRRR